MKTKVQIDDRYNSGLKLKRKISKIVNLLFQIEEVRKNCALKGFEFGVLAFDIVLTDDKEIKQINKTYRKKNSPTDVITFALFCDCEDKFVFDETIELGEIIISIDTAQKQKTSSVENEVLLLICHGILHLLGFDHLNDKDYNFVVGIQNSVMSKI